jgi:hypothetical protein
VPTGETRNHRKALSHHLVYRIAHADSLETQPTLPLVSTLVLSSSSREAVLSLTANNNLSVSGEVDERPALREVTRLGVSRQRVVSHSRDHLLPTCTLHGIVFILSFFTLLELEGSSLLTILLE